MVDQFEELKNVTNKEDDNSAMALSHHGTIAPSRHDKIKPRSKQHRKPFYFDDNLNSLWIKFESQQLADGQRITFQGVVENLLEKYLKRNIK